MKSIYAILASVMAAAFIGAPIAGPLLRNVSVAAAPSAIASRLPPVSLPAPTLFVSSNRFPVGQSGSKTPFVLGVNYTGGAGFLFVDQDSVALASTPSVASLGGGQFAVTLQTSDVVPEGVYRGSVRLRVCQEAPCVHVLTSAWVSLHIRLNWTNAGEWETFQRTRGHTGYVPVLVNPTHIVQKWEWQAPSPLDDLSGVATSAGKVFITEAAYAATLHSLDERNGTELWHHDFPPGLQYQPILNSPSAAGDKVFIATTGHELTAMWALNLADGSTAWQTAFDTQWQHVLAPTVSNGRVYTNGGYYGGGVYAYTGADGTFLWSRYGGDDDTTTPALDDANAYFYDGARLQVFDAVTGNGVASIPDPYVTSSTGYNLGTAPMLGESDHIIVGSGDQGGLHYLVDFSLRDYLTRWRSARQYTTAPAVANGVIYAGSGKPASFDAIDEPSGNVLWSWAPPDAWNVAFTSNVILTRNLAFVCTSTAVYAISLTSHRMVWSWSPETYWSIADSQGLAISGGGMLYVKTGAGLTALALH